MIKHINLSYKYLPEKKYELTREIRTEYILTLCCLKYTMRIWFSGKDGKLDYKEVYTEVRLTDKLGGKNKAFFIDEDDVIKTLCTMMSILLTGDYVVEEEQ